MPGMLLREVCDHELTEIAMPVPRPDQITGTPARLVLFGSAAGLWTGLDRTACISAQE
jgi:hypothetical protein